MQRLWSRFCTLLLCIGFALPATAQDLPESVFRDYDHMRKVLDDGMMQRNIVDVMRAFGASDEMTVEQLNDLEDRVRTIFPAPFSEVEIMKSEKMGASWTQEMYAYNAGYSYIYAMVLFHQQDNAVVAVQFKFNTDPLEILADF